MTLGGGTIRILGARGLRKKLSPVEGFGPPTHYVLTRYFPNMELLIQNSLNLPVQYITWYPIPRIRDSSYDPPWRKTRIWLLIIKMMRYRVNSTDQFTLSWKCEVKQAQRAKSRPVGQPARSRARRAHRPLVCNIFNCTKKHNCFVNFPN